MSTPRISETSMGNYTHKIEWRHGKERRRQFFTSLADAQKELARVNPLVAKVGTAGLSMDARERDEYRAAKRILADGGCRLSLAEVARLYLVANPVGNGDMPWRDAVTTYLTEKERRGRTDATTRTLKNILEAFARTRAPLIVGEVTKEDAEDFIFDGTVKGRTQIKRRAVLGGFFGWLVKKGKLAKSPVADSEQPHADSTLPEVYSAEEVQRVLDAARKHGGLRYYAIAALAGLRQSEIMALIPAAISENHIAVLDGKKRSRTKRVVPVCARLKKLLAETKDDPIKWHPKLHAAVKESAAVTWQPDVLRHTWFSFRLAQTGDAARTSMEGGNDPSTMARYYINAKTKESAEAYFGETKAKPNAKRNGQKRR